MSTPLKIDSAQIKRGLLSQLPGLLPGEQYWAKDTKQLFIGTNEGPHSLKDNTEYKTFEVVITETHSSLNPLLIIDDPEYRDLRSLEKCTFIIDDQVLILEGQAQKGTFNIGISGTALQIYYTDNESFDTSVFSNDGTLHFSGNPEMYPITYTLIVPKIPEGVIRTQLEATHFVDEIVFTSSSSSQTTALKSYFLEDVVDKLTLYANGVLILEDGVPRANLMFSTTYAFNYPERSFIFTNNDFVLQIVFGVRSGVDDYGIIQNLTLQEDLKITVAVKKETYVQALSKKKSWVLKSFEFEDVSTPESTTASVLDLGGAADLIYSADFYKAKTLVLVDLIADTALAFPFIASAKYSFEIPGFTALALMEQNQATFTFTPTNPGNNLAMCHIIITN